MEPRAKDRWVTILNQGFAPAGIAEHTEVQLGERCKNVTFLAIEIRLETFSLIDYGTNIRKRAKSVLGPLAAVIAIFTDNSMAIAATAQS